MKITTIDKAVAKSLAEEAINVLTKHFADKGIDIGRKNGTYTPDDFKLPIVFKVRQNAAGVRPLPPEAKEYNARRMFNSKMVELNTEIIFDGEKYTIIGWKPRARKSPVLVMDRQGKRYRLPERYCMSK